MLFFQFVIAQFSVLLKAQKEVKESSLKLGALKENLSVLANISEGTLDSQLKILNSALPLNKDFIGILNSIYFAAQATGVNLGSFSFKVGDISKSENGGNFPSVKLSVPINSGVSAINSFIKKISEMLPLSEVYLVKVGDVSSTVGLSFYYKPLNAANYSQDVRVNPVSQKVLTLVGQLSKFKNVSTIGE